MIAGQEPLLYQPVAARASGRLFLRASQIEPLGFPGAIKNPPRRCVAGGSERTAESESPLETSLRRAATTAASAGLDEGDSNHRVFLAQPTKLRNFPGETAISIASACFQRIEPDRECVNLNEIPSAARSSTRLELPYRLCDVFTATCFQGNQLAVFEDAGELTTAEMQRLANETNLSETTFIIRRDSAIERAEGNARAYLYHPARSCLLPVIRRWAPRARSVASFLNMRTPSKSCSI